MVRAIRAHSRVELGDFQEGHCSDGLENAKARNRRGFEVGVSCIRLRPGKKGIPSTFLLNTSTPSQNPGTTRMRRCPARHDMCNHEILLHYILQAPTSFHLALSGLNIVWLWLRRIPDVGVILHMA